MYEIFERLVKERDTSAYKVSKETGVGQATLSDWKRGVSVPKAETLSRLADYFGVTVDYLMGREQTKKAPTDEGERVIRVPVLGAIPAGIPIEAIEEIVDWEEIPASMARGGKEFFGLRVKGDSMYPDFLDGDTVILCRATTCDSGDVCAVLINGNDATLKKVKLGEDGSVTLVPRNTEYSPKTYSRDEVINTPVGILGVVVELRRRINN